MAGESGVRRMGDGVRGGAGKGERKPGDWGGADGWCEILVAGERGDDAGEEVEEGSYMGGGTKDALIWGLELSPTSRAACRSEA
jgi:hypothetical protein